MNRRQLLALVVGSVVTRLTSDVFAQATVPAGNGATTEVDVGSPHDYSQDGSYDEHRASGIVLVRRDDRLYAFSARCPHKGCKVRAADEGGFRCPCHGSTFDAEGRVMTGPATANLTALKLKLTSESRVLVKLPTA